jgi:RNA polymerase sigma-70 factor (ECF subfamily)
MAINNELFWQQLEKEHEKARGYCGRLAGRFDEGDDLYQEAVIRAFNGYGQLRNIDAFRPWFYRIINNTYKARFRTGWWRRVLTKPMAPEDIERHDNPVGLYEARRRLEYAFRAISADDRIIITMVELEGWKIPELAKLMAKSEGFIKMRLFRARNKMRKTLAASCLGEVEEIFRKRTENLCCVTRPEKD